MIRYRGPHTDEDSSGWLFRVFVGVDLAQARRWAGIAGVLFVIPCVVVAVASPSFPLPVEGVTVFELFWPTAVLHATTVFGAVVILSWVGLAMWPAYRNVGLLVSWGLLVSPMWGALLGAYLYAGAGRSVSVGPPFMFFMFLLIAISLGTLGFILGTGLRRIRSW